MTVSTQTTRVSYTGNGTTTAFAVPFSFFAAGDLVVIERVTASGVETIKSLTTHYTVTGGNGAPGTVTALTAPADTVSWTIHRRTPATQEVDYQPNDSFPAETHERALDRLTFLGQELRDAMGRALVFPSTDPYGLLAALPPSVARANKAFIFDASGAPALSPEPYTALAGSTTAAAGSATAAAASATTAAGSAAAAAASATTAATIVAGAGGALQFDVLPAGAAIVVPAGSQYLVCGPLKGPDGASISGAGRVVVL